MRVVVAIPYTPWPVRKGTNRLIVNLLDGLSREHETALVTMTEEPWELERIKELESTNLMARAMLAPHRRGVGAKLFHKAKNIALSLLVGIPQEVSYAAPGEFLKLIADVSEELDADVILASYWHLYRLPEYVRGSKAVLITHDLDFIVNQRRMRFFRSSQARLLASRRARLLERIEKKAYRSYEAILTVTPLDAELLKGYPFAEGKFIEPLPLALDLSEFAYESFERKDNTILLLGSFQADFNRDAFFWFNGEVLPMVTKEVEEARLEVVGFGIDDEMRKKARGNVDLVGGVKDIRPHLGRCSLMVLPLRFCGGVRIRMLEAAAMGTPVVSTAIGVEGMGLREGEHYLKGDDPREMASAIVSLLRDRNKAKKLSKDLREWAEQNISMEDYPRRLTRLLENIVEI